MPMKPVLLVDGDVVAFRCASSAEDDTAGIAKARMEWMLVGIMDDLQSDRYRIFLSGDRNFRNEIYPDYKANRRDRPRPRFLEDCREHLVKYWQAELSDGWEADDSLGIEASRPLGLEESPPIICSIDKDLKQIPGQHWNFVKKEFEYVSPELGIYRFYRQVLTGDPTDNIPGLKGIGPVKAKRILEELNDEYGLFTRVRREYSDDSFLLLQGCLVWIMREEGKQWEFPYENIELQGEGPEASSMGEGHSDWVQSGVEE